MENFNAQNARDLSSGQDANELSYIIDLIKSAARDRKNVCYIYNKPLSEDTISELANRQFIIISACPICGPKDGLYNTIKW